VRQHLIELVWARVQRFGVDHNPATVLDPEATAELTALLETVRDPAADLEVAQVAGWLHWCRYLVLDPGDDHQDLIRALALFAPLYRKHPDVVPPEVRTHFGRPAASGDPLVMAGRAATLLEEAQRSGEPGALNRAIDLFQQAVAATPAGHPDSAAILSNLGGALRTRFASTANRADLDAAITVGQQAVATAPADYPHRATIMSTLSGALQIRFDSTGNRADLNAAIDLLQQALAASPAGHPDHAARLYNLGILLQIPFASTGRADLNAAIDLLRKAVAATPAGHPDRAGRLSDLGIALRIRFASTGNRADLDAAITAGRQAVAASPDDHPDHAARLSDLGIALQTRFASAGNRADLDAAITADQQAVAASPAGHPHHAESLANLGIHLRARFASSGNRADLDAAITADQQAVAASPAGHPHHAESLSNLSVALQTRFDSTGNRADLNAAIDLLQQALAASLAGHPHRAGWLSNLGLALQTRFARTRDTDPADLDAAITAGRQAVAATPDDHPDRAARLSNLGGALRTRFASTGDPADLDAAIDLLQQVVAASPADHHHRAGWLSNLGIALQDRWARTGDPADLDAAVNRFQQAVAASPDDHPDRAGRGGTLGSALHARFVSTGDLADLDAAIGLFQQAAVLEVASPRIRAAAAREWGRAAGGTRRFQEAVAGFATATGLLGLVAPRSLIRDDREYLLEELGSLGADAAACCVHAGQPDRAVELFEQGRGVLLGQALDTRTDLTALTGEHPGLAARFTALRDDLDQADYTSGSAMTPQTGLDGVAMGARVEAVRWDIERRQAIAVSFNEVIDEIRRLPDFHGFLRPPKMRELLAAAAQGPVVVVTVSRFGSHALILTSGGVLNPVPLPGLTPEAVSDQVEAFLSAWSPSADADGWAAAEQRLGGTLGWLWAELASPVLDRLGINGPPADGQPWPRLWWCVSGLLSFLPVHAAGHHHTWADAVPATVIDRVISSYTPTIRALTHARRPRSGSGDRVVAVAMPHTPGASDLPGAQEEVAELQQRFPGRVTVLTGPQATHDTVLAALRASQWAHFSCHGASDLGNPSTSRLLLIDHGQRPLTVVDVARLRLDDAGLAFLSACSTARPGGRLTDEAIHLASAFQLAGYRNVIATLWPIVDWDAVKITTDIYAALATCEDDVAVAVHSAVRQMRQGLGPDSLLRWASHIHVGA
jgi:tetratricopeptide (TPR) repeat protein